MDRQMLPTRASENSTPKLPLLRDLCSQAHGLIDRAFGFMSDIDESMERLLNPKPTPVPGVGGSQAEPAPQTVEGELCFILHRLDGLCDRAEDIAHRLQSAI